LLAQQLLRVPAVMTEDRIHCTGMMVVTMMVVAMTVMRQRI
jgi:hypothetical protein